MFTKGASGLLKIQTWHQWWIEPWCVSDTAFNCTDQPVVSSLALYIYHSDGNIYTDIYMYFFVYPYICIRIDKRVHIYICITRVFQWVLTFFSAWIAFNLITQWIWHWSCFLALLTDGAYLGCRWPYRTSWQYHSPSCRSGNPSRSNNYEGRLSCKPK